MFKRIFILVLAALMMVSAALPAVSGDSASAPETDPNAPVTVQNGAVEIEAGTTAAELRACFKEKSSVMLTGADGKALNMADVLGTGAKVTKGGESVTVILPGDVNGDGKITVRDAMAAMNLMLSPENGAAKSAADVEHDGDLNSRDIVKLMKYLVGWDEDLSSKKPITAQNEEAGLTVYFDSIMHRIGRELTDIFGPAEGLIRLAKNETEDIQIMVVSDEKRSGLDLEVTPLVSESGAELEFVLRYGYYYEFGMFTQLRGKNYGNTGGGSNFVEPMPLYDGAFDVGENENRMFAVIVKAPSDAESGWYSSDVILRDDKGREVKRSVLRVYVWDFALDETPACGTAFELNYGSVMGKHFDDDMEALNKAPGEELGRIRETWYEYMLDNKISAYHMPHDFGTEKAEEYMSDPRVTTFCAAGGGASNRVPFNQIEYTYRTYLAGHDDWLDKAYIYTIDEPYRDEQFDYLDQQWAYLNEHMSDIPFWVMVPLAGNNYISSTKLDFVEMIQDSINWWCVSSSAFTPYATKEMQKADPYNYPAYALPWCDRISYPIFGEFKTRAESFRARGDKMWWYVCVGPEFPYANFFRAYQGVCQRVLFWQQYLHDVDGILYWCVNYWTIDGGGKVGLNKTNGGDGLLLYWGELWGQTGPVPTVRWEYVRDGIEDFQYLRQIEAALGRDAALAFSNRITTGMLVFSEDYKEMESVRTEMGFLLESLGA